jgi:hypothetical protein
VVLGQLKLAVACGSVAVSAYACRPEAPSSLPSNRASAAASARIEPVTATASASTATAGTAVATEEVARATAEPKETSRHASPLGAPTSIRGAPSFETPEVALDTLVRRDAKTPQNHFCVVAYRLANGELQAWVHWLEGNAIILWEPRIDDPAHGLVWSRRYLRLDRDVVASEDDVAGSTYRVTKSWVEGIVEDCASAGDRFVVEKRAGGK